MSNYTLIYIIICIMVTVASLPLWIFFSLSLFYLFIISFLEFGIDLSMPVVALDWISILGVRAIRSFSWNSFLSTCVKGFMGREKEREREREGGRAGAIY